MSFWSFFGDLFSITRPPVPEAEFAPTVPFLPAPQPSGQFAETQNAVINALITFIERDGSKVTTVRVPGFLGVPEGMNFKIPATGSDFAVVPVLDPFGNNVIVTPAPICTTLMRTVLDDLAVTTNPRTANTASAAVDATTVTPKAD